MSMFLTRTVRSLTSFARQALARASTPALPVRRAAAIESLEDRSLLSLTLDLRLAQGGGKSATVGVGQIVNINVYAKVNGADTNTANDLVKIAATSFLSTGGTKGDLTFFLTDVFSAGATHDSDNEGIYKSAHVDLDGDGDLDIGSNSNTSMTGYVFGRSGDFEPAGTGNGVLLGTLRFTVTGGSGSTQIWARPHGEKTFGFGGLWIEDGVQKNGGTGTINSDPVVVTVSSGGGGSANTFAKLADGTLSVNGTKSHDSLTLSTVGKQIRVTLNGKTESVVASQVKKIIVDGKGGNDTINASKLSKGATLLGGEGNDKIFGSAFADYLGGGNGNDSLFGGAANDVLEGGKGTDQLFGEDGKDRLLSKDGIRDVVNGGGGIDTAVIDLKPKHVADQLASVERVG